MRATMRAIRLFPRRMWRLRPRRWGVTRTTTSGQVILLDQRFTSRRGAKWYARETNRLVTTLGEYERRQIEERPYRAVNLREVEL